MRELNRKEQVKLMNTTEDSLKAEHHSAHYHHQQLGSPMYSQVCSIFLLMNVAHIYTHKPLINMVATSILHPSPPPQVFVFSFSLSFLNSPCSLFHKITNLLQLCFLRPKSYRDAKATGFGHFSFLLFIYLISKSYDSLSVPSNGPNRC